jgi:hypothetical protein
MKRGKNKKQIFRERLLEGVYKSFSVWATSKPRD